MDSLSQDQVDSVLNIQKIHENHHMDKKEKEKLACHNEACQKELLEYVM
jgi:hypothetical protein